MSKVINAKTGEVSYRRTRYKICYYRQVDTGSGPYGQELIRVEKTGLSRDEADLFLKCAPQRGDYWYAKEVESVVESSHPISD